VPEQPPNAPAGPAGEQLIALAGKAAAATIPGQGEVGYVRTTYQGHPVVVGPPGTGFTMGPLTSSTRETWSTKDGATHAIGEKGTMESIPADGPFARSKMCTSDVTSENLPGRVGWAADEQSATIMLFKMIGSCQLSVPTAPEAHSAMLTLLAGQADVLPLGQVTDALGRSGVGFYVEMPAEALSLLPGGAGRLVLTFDPQTGALLAYTTTVTNDPQNHAPVPYDISTELLEVYTMVGAVGDVP